ncbi:MAG TPA: alpha/beta hydrolase [Allosphingosinicella sp.]|jgi:hypothetical protein
MWALKLLLIPIFLYLAILVALYFGQTSMIFPARAVQGAGPLPPGAQPLSVETADGETLRGLHIPPSRAGKGTLVLGFGGNAWNAQAAADYLHNLYPEADVVVFHYRGYRPSTGKPSGAALMADAPLVLDAAFARLRPTRTVAVGFSIGSGVAASLAGKRPLAGLILVTPFDSLAGVGAGHYPWLPVRLLFRHEMKPARWLAETATPTAILAGETDTLIPPARTDALRRATRNLVYDRTISGSGHNDIYDRPDFRAAMREALAAVEGASHL